MVIKKKLALTLGGLVAMGALTLAYADTTGTTTTGTTTTGTTTTGTTTTGTTTGTTTTGTTTTGTTTTGTTTVGTTTTGSSTTTGSTTTTVSTTTPVLVPSAPNMPMATAINGAYNKLEALLASDPNAATDTSDSKHTLYERLYHRYSHLSAVQARIIAKQSANAHRSFRWVTTKPQAETDTATTGATTTAEDIDRAARLSANAHIQAVDHISVDRPEKMERPEMAERPELVERPEMPERPERPERPEPIERALR